MNDLGFTYRINKNGGIVIQRHGRTVTTIRGKRAIDFKEQSESLSFDDLQQVMARLTGNYKRGNERVAKNHPKNQF